MDPAEPVRRFWAAIYGHPGLDYIAVRREPDIESEEQLNGKGRSVSTLLMRALSLTAWAFAIFVLLTMFLVNFSLWNYNCDKETLVWDMPSSDMPESLFTYEKRRFTNAIRDDPDGNLFSFFDPTEPQYIGNPSPTIDENWDHLLDGRYFRLMDGEVESLNQDPKRPPLAVMHHNERIASDGYYGGPGVLHSLHCLNAIRKRLNIKYYADSMTLPPEYQQMHIDHCVDHLRQALLCHGDLTPVTMKPVIANTSLPYPVTFYLGQTEREHTCRSSSAIRKWVTARGQRTGSIGPHRPQGRSVPE